MRAKSLVLAVQATFILLFPFCCQITPCHELARDMCDLVQLAKLACQEERREGIGCKGTLPTDIGRFGALSELGKIFLEFP